MATVTAEAASIVEVRGLTKRFGRVVANDRIDLSIRAGEVLALLGENGAGKTTLMNILAGMIHADAGLVLVGGRRVEIASPRDAHRLGIGTVFQHFTLVPNLSVIENVVLGQHPGFVLDLEAAEHRLLARLGGFAGMAIPPRTPVGQLSLGQQQRVEIVKTLARGPAVLLLDEPTSVLTGSEVDELFAILRRLRAEGVAVVLITHKLDEALAVSDRVAILRDGRTVGELTPPQLATKERTAVRQRVVELMFGGSPPNPPIMGGSGPADHEPAQQRATAPPIIGGRGAATAASAPTLLELRGVSARSDRGAAAVSAVSVQLRAGEIFGIAGIDGNGQKELAEIMAGQRPVTAGRIMLDGREVTGRGVAAFGRAGIGYLTDDRLGEGSVGVASVAENLVLKAVARQPFTRRFWLNRTAIERNARQLIADFAIRAPSPWARLSTLSGGNVQKVLLARELAARPRVLIANKPTHGLDLRTTEFILDRLRAHADAGNQVVLISSELEELLAVSDRIGVMVRGRLTDVVPRREASAASLGALMLRELMPA